MCGLSDRVYSPEWNFETTFEIRAPGIFTEIHSVFLIGTYECENKVITTSAKPLFTYAARDE